MCATATVLILRDNYLYFGHLYIICCELKVMYVHSNAEYISRLISDVAHYDKLRMRYRFNASLHLRVQVEHTHLHSRVKLS